MSHTLVELERLMRSRPLPGRAGITPEEALAERLDALRQQVEAVERRLERIEAQQRMILEALTFMRRPARVGRPQPGQQRLPLERASGVRKA